MKRFLQKKSIGFLVNHIFHAIGKEDILQIEFDPRNMEPSVKYKDKKLNQEAVVKIREDAEIFEKSILWKFMENRIRYESQEKMFPLSQVDTDLIFGKAMLYDLDVIKQVIKEIKNIPQGTPTPRAT